MNRFAPPSALSLALAATIACAAPAGAETAQRFGMLAVEGGVIRLDQTTGRMSFCARNAGGAYACAAVEDDRSAYMDELEAMAKQIATLRQQLAEAQSGGLKLPNERELDQAFDMMQRFMDRFGPPARQQSQPQQGPL
jgi:hypothetical protein